MFQQMGKMKKIIVQAPTLSASTTPTNCWAQVLSELLLTKQLKTGSPWQWSDLTRPLGKDVGFFCWYGKDHHRTQKLVFEFWFYVKFMCFIQQFHKVSHFCFFFRRFLKFLKMRDPQIQTATPMASKGVHATPNEAPGLIHEGTEPDCRHWNDPNMREN